MRTALVLGRCNVSARVVAPYVTVQLFSYDPETRLRGARPGWRCLRRRHDLEDRGRRRRPHRGAYHRQARAQFQSAPLPKSSL